MVFWWMKDQYFQGGSPWQSFIFLLTAAREQCYRTAAETNMDVSFNIWCCVFDLFYNRVLFFVFFFFLSFLFFKSDVKPPEIPGFQLLIYWAYWGTTMSRSWQLDWRQRKTFIWSTNSIFMASVWICFILCIVLLYPMCLDNCILLDLWFSSTSVSVAAVSCSGW